MQSKFKGNINTYRRNEYIGLILLISIFPLSILFTTNKIGFSIFLISLLVIIIYLLIKYDKEKNYFEFENSSLIYHKKETKINFDYSELQKIEFINSLKNQPFVNIYFSKSKFRFRLETFDNKNFVYTDFIEFIFNKNSNCLVIEKNSKGNFKYFRKDNKILKAQIYDY